MRRRRLVQVAGAVAIGVALAIVWWRPWRPPVGPPAAVDPDPPADTAAVTIVKRSGGPCRVELRGTAGGAANLASASLPAGAARSVPLQFPAPYTIEAVTVTRDGPPQRREVKAPLAGGRRYELLVNADDTVALAPASR